MSRTPHDRRGRGSNSAHRGTPHPRLADRNSRVAMDVNAIIARALREDVKDPRVADLTITAVRMSRDLSIAHINVVPLGGRGDAERLMQGLDAASGFLRSVLGQQIRLRHTPRLQFHMDDGLDDSLAMTRRLSEMERDRAAQDLRMAAEDDDQDSP